MEQTTKDLVKLARQHEYTWASISLFLSIPEHILKYHVKMSTRPQKPINEW